MGTIRTVWQWYRNYFAAGGYGVLFAAGLCWLWHNRAKEQGKRVPVFLWPVIMLLAVIFCPVTARAIMQAIGEDVYWRVFWMLPVVPAAAWMFTGMTGKMRRNWQRILAALGCAGLLALNGTWVFGETFFQPRENNYKLPTRVILVGDAIEEHAQAHGEKKRVVAQMDIAVLIRLYKPEFISYYGRRMLMKPQTQTELYDQINADEPDPETLVTLSEKYHYRYIVLKTTQDNREAMLQEGLEVVMEGGGYVVYYDPYYALKEEEET